MRFACHRLSLSLSAHVDDYDYYNYWPIINNAHGTQNTLCAHYALARATEFTHTLLPSGVAKQQLR